MYKTSRPDSSKKQDLTPKLTNEQYKALSKMYSTSNLSALLKQTDNKKPAQKPVLASQFITNTPRNNTPKSCRTALEAQSKYFFAQKNALLQREGKPQNNSQLLQRTQQLSQHRNFSNLNLSTGKDTPKLAQPAKFKPQTDRKYNLYSIDFEKAAAKLKQQDSSRFSSHQIVTQMAQNIMKQTKPIEQTQQSPQSKPKQPNNNHFSLDDFVTQVTRGNPSSRSPQTPSQLKQTKSLSPSSRIQSSNVYKRNLYYVSGMVEAYKNSNMPQSQLYRDHGQQTYNCIGFCLNLKETPQHVIESKKQYIAFKESLKFKKTVVFDLDETLIHCNENQTLKADTYIPITFPSGDSVSAGINIRPFAKWILVALSELCEVIIFTASHACYASKVIDHIDTSRCVSARMFRDSCVVSEDGVHIKDLNVLNRDPRDIVLVDNAAYSFGMQIENGIPIIPFYDDKNDQQLKHLYDFLVQYVLPAKDSRTVLQETFKLREFANYVGPKSAIEKLYC